MIMNNKQPADAAQGAVKHYRTPYYFGIDENGDQCIAAENHEGTRPIFCTVSTKLLQERYSALGVSIKYVSDEMDAATAEFIVRACNSHELLLKAVEAALPVMENMLAQEAYKLGLPMETVMHIVSDNPVIIDFRAALRAAGV